MIVKAILWGTVWALVIACFDLPLWLILPAGFFLGLFDYIDDKLEKRK